MINRVAKNPKYAKLKSHTFKLILVYALITFIFIKNFKYIAVFTRTIK